MFSSEDAKARFDNPAVITAINSLAESVHSIYSLEKLGYIGDGDSIILDLDTLVNVLLNQITACVPRDKQHSILSSHGLEEYIDNLDEVWNRFEEYASSEERL